MAGWTYTGPTKAIGLFNVGTHGAGPDMDSKTSSAFPALAAGNIGWWQDFAFWVGLEFAKQCRTKSPNVATLIVSANNGAGDTNGVGVALTITLTTA